MSPVVTDPEGRRYELRPASCPTCGPRATRFVGIRGGRYHRYGLGVESTIVRCSGCGLLFPDPFPHPLDAQEMYGDPDNYFISHGDFGSKAERRRALIREIVQRTGTSDPTILDVGAGRGETLEAARLEGVTTAVGLEFSTAMIEYAGAHGLRVRQQTAEEFADTTADTFDAVVLAAVAEHVADPDSLLRAAARLTCTGGVLMIDVPRDPNIVTMLHRTWQRLRRSPGVLNLSPTFSPYHVYGFDPRSLRRLLTKHGYRIEHMLISAAPSVINNGTVKDRLMSMAGGALIRIGNRTGLAPNMTVWARRQ